VEAPLVLKIFPFALLGLVAFPIPALADPPPDIEACIKLSADTAKAAQVDSEVKYVKFHMRLMDLDTACGARDYVAAEKISDEIKATFPSDK
jgi:hypothetical protein